MTAESALQPRVSSPVGARGMMQLMPYVAEELHPLLFEHQPFDSDTLFQSGYNVSLGTKELMKLSDNLSDLKLEDPLPMVIAGYNGGEEALTLDERLENRQVYRISDDIGARNEAIQSKSAGIPDDLSICVRTRTVSALDFPVRAW